VDEYQDVNPIQCRLLRFLAQTTDGAVCAVGDSDQAIYAFRGADIENFLHFQKGLSGRRRGGPGRELPFNRNDNISRDRTDQTERAADRESYQKSERIWKAITIMTVPDERMEAEQSCVRSKSAWEGRAISA